MAAVVLAVHFLLAVTSVIDKSNTYDELAYVTSGYAYWTEHDYRMNPENGILPQRWFGLPLLTMGLHLPNDTNPAAWNKGDVWAFGKSFFFEAGNDVDTMLWRARCMNALLSVGLGLLVYGWSRRLFGPAGGILSLALYATDPTILANGSLATADMAAAAFFAASVGCVWKICHKVAPATILCGGLALSGLALSKTSAVLILPISALMLALRIWDGRPLSLSWRGHKEWTVERRMPQLGILLGVVLLETVLVITAIWACYGFRYSAFAEPRTEDDQFLYSWQEVLSNTGAAGKAMAMANDYHVLPEAYLMGSAITVYGAQKRLAFLNGQFSTTGWPYFFPYTFLVKTPLLTFLLLGAALAGAVWTWRPAKPKPKAKGKSAVADQKPPFRAALWQGFYATSPLWFLLAIYWAVAIQSHLNIGHRHLLPIYPVIFIFLGAATHWSRREDGAGRTMLAGAVACTFLVAVDCMLTHPNYLTYFNALAGGPSNGHKHLVDSSLDWGQDLPALKRWLVAQGLDNQTQTPVYIHYFGTAYPSHFGIHGKDLTREPTLTPGIYCISASNFRRVYTIPTQGRWCIGYEKAYQESLAAMRVWDSADMEGRKRLVATKGEAYWDQTLTMFIHLRLSRLYASLQNREPDDQIGHSILVFRLTAQDLQKATLGPPAEQSAEPVP